MAYLKSINIGGVENMWIAADEAPPAPLGTSIFKALKKAMDDADTPSEKKQPPASKLFFSYWEVVENYAHLDLVRTQKAKGIFALTRTMYHRMPTTKWASARKLADMLEAGGDPTLLNYMLDRFVRPCPITPRHGFVDSRIINTLDEAAQIVLETLEAGPEAELVIQNRVKALYSSIWTPGTLVIGPDNDGATAGRESISLPVVGNSLRGINDEMLQAAGVTESPYVEMVYGAQDLYDEGRKYAYSHWTVQLRNGPTLPQDVDYIPEKMKVTNVVVAEGELLDWEKRVDTLPPGTVVNHFGGSLASHYAVHAVLHSIPVITSRVPKVGETLKPSKLSKVKPSLKMLRAGFVEGCTNPSILPGEAAYLMLAGCHNTSLWLGKFDALLGMAIGCAYRLIVTASLGEYRHHPGSKFLINRDRVYDGVWHKVLEPSVTYRYFEALRSFEHDEWDDGYGGGAWLKFAQWAAIVRNEVALNGDVTEILEILNEVTNAVHNGGWAFDKFVPSGSMTVAASSPAFPAAKCAPFLYECLKRLSNPEHVDNLLSWYEGRKPLAEEPQDAAAALADIEADNRAGTSKYCPNCEYCWDDCDCTDDHSEEPPSEVGIPHGEITAVYAAWYADTKSVMIYKEGPENKVEFDVANPGPDGESLIKAAIALGEATKTSGGQTYVAMKQHSEDDRFWYLGIEFGCACGDHKGSLIYRAK